MSQSALCTDLDIMLLGLLAEANRYGHELEALIDARDLRAWLRIGTASLYQALAYLAAQRLIAIRPGNAPETAIYSLTEAGRGVLQTAVTDRLRQPDALGTGIELALASLHTLRPAAIAEALRERRDILLERLRFVEADAVMPEAKFDATDAGVRNGLLYAHAAALGRAELAWLDDLLRRIEVVAPVAQPAETDAANAPTLIHRRTEPKGGKRLQRISSKRGE